MSDKFTIDELNELESKAIRHFDSVEDENLKNALIELGQAAYILSRCLGGTRDVKED